MQDCMGQRNKDDLNIHLYNDHGCALIHKLASHHNEVCGNTHDTRYDNDDNFYDTNVVDT